MRITSAFLCNHVEVQASMLYVHGGFPEWWTIPELPSQQQVGLGIVVEIGTGELGRDLGLDVEVSRVDGAAVLTRSEVRFRREPSDQYVAEAPFYVPLPLSLGVRFDDVGPHLVTVTAAGVEPTRVRFGVRVAP